MSDVHVHADAEALAAEVASRLLARLEQAQSRGERPQVALTGGTIADLVHREVARRAAESGVDWTRVGFWWGDERFVPADSEDRNARQAREALLAALPLDAAQVHEVPASDQVGSAEAAAAAYGEALAAGGEGAFEVLMLGVGPDGHVASLFPGHAALDVEDELAVAVHDSPKPPPDRVSLTFGALNKARAVWFLVSGTDKAAAVAAALAGGDRHEIPARGVRGTDETLWLVDEAAAASSV